jgi:anti-sigma B factor antagonist/stage II sporulation protein AA (anti-sigma F factor antagonist)
VTELASLEMHRDGQRCFLRVAGEVDMSNVPDLMTRIEEVLPNDVPIVVMDLTRTTYLDSAGIQLVFEVARRLRVRRHQVAIVAPQDGPVRAVLDMVGLSALVSLYERADDVPEVPDDDWPVAP